MGYRNGTTAAQFLIPTDKLTDAAKIVESDNLLEDLQEMGFNAETTDDGLTITGYDFENQGDEEEYLITLAPYVKAGSYLEWEGEDSLRWRWDFDGEDMFYSTGHTAFHPRIDYDTLRETVRDGLNADSGDAEREALAEAGQMLGLVMNNDDKYE